MYGFDLVAWLRGDISRSVTAVIALLQGLPDESSFKAHWFATLKMRGSKQNDVRTDEQKRFDALVGEYELWSGSNLVLSQVGNAVHLNTMVTGHLKDHSQLPFLGPSLLRDETSSSQSADSVSGFYQLLTGMQLPE